LEINSQEQMILLITICKGGNLQANWYKYPCCNCLKV